jgi:hypothetical protein
MKAFFSFFSFFVAICFVKAQPQIPVTGQLPPPSYNILPSSVRAQIENPSLQLETNFTLEDQYNDIPIPITSVAESGYPINDPMHELVSEAVLKLGVGTYMRHFKSHSFKRIPLCEGGAEPFFNLNYLNNDLCDETPTGQNIPWIERILSDGQQQNMTTGLYIQAMSDFFF